MTNNTFKSSEIDFEDRFVKWEELGLDKPTVTPRALWVWGTGNGGTLGLNSSGNLLIDTQTRVGSLTDWKQVSGNSSATLSVKTNGTLWSWGFGALGLNDTTSRSSPVQVGTDTNWKFIEAGQGFVHAIRTSGALWVWGTQAVVSLQGVLGLNDNSNRSSPIQVGTSTDWKQVSSGQDHSVAVKTNGTLWGWGQQPTGTLGLNNLTARSSPTQIGASADWKLISVGSDTNAPASGASFAIKTNGTLWSWGAGTGGRLGQNNTTNRSSPAQVGTLTDWWSVSTNSSPAGSPNHAISIKTDGTIWSWGYGSNGQLGLGNTLNRSSPSQIGALTDWKQASAGRVHCLAIKNDGSLWGWGSSTNDQLAGSPGITQLFSSPVQLGSGNNWAVADAIDLKSLVIKFN